MQFQSYLINIVLAAMLAVALYTDVTRGKVYNKLTVPCIGLGFVLNATMGWSHLLTSVQGIGVGFLALVVISLLRLMGGGDAKLLIAVGALKGAGFLLSAMLFTALAGGVLAILFLVYRKLLKVTLSDIGNKTFARVVLRAPIDMMPTLRAGKLPYSVAIAAGVAIAIVRINIGGVNG